MAVDRKGINAVEGQAWPSINDLVAIVFLFIGAGAVLFLALFFVFEAVFRLLTGERKFTIAGIIAFTICVAVLCAVYSFFGIK